MESKTIGDLEADTVPNDVTNGENSDDNNANSQTSECKDQDAVRCKRWKQATNDICKSDTDRIRRYMEQYCGETCGLCNKE